MSLPDATSASDLSSHLYPQAIQLKLYQAFIFSIPVLFSIILFLLFYLFYLKRRSLAAASASTSPSRTTAAQSSYLDSHSPCQKGLLKEKLKEILPTVPFNEDLQAKDTTCSVCLGEFEIAEELIQIPICKHIFHLDCIHYWLFSQSTCPLCRCSVYLPNANTKLVLISAPLSSWESVDTADSDHSSQVVISVANLQSREHVIEVGDLLERVTNSENTDTSHSRHYGI